MKEARKKLEDLIEKTTTDCENIRKTYDSKDYIGRPYEAVQLFYPDLKDIEEKQGLVYASCFTGDNVPPVLAELLIGMPVLENLYECSNLDSFKKTYNMSPDEFATEAKEKRLFPVIYVDDPRVWKDETLEGMRPVIETNTVQMAGIRTKAFENWFTAGQVQTIEQEAEKLFKEYFPFPLKADEEKDVYQQVRVDKNSSNLAEDYKNKVVGRLRNIISLYPQITGDMAKVFSDLRDRATLMKAEVLNGVKNIVVSPVTAARGGVFRVSQEQKKEIESLAKYKDLSSTLNEIFESDLKPDLYTADLIEFLEEMFMVPALKHLDYPRYHLLIEQPFWRDFQKGIANALSIMRREMPADPESFLAEARKKWKETINTYTDCFRSYLRAEWELTWVLAPLAGAFTYISYGSPYGFTAARLGLRFLFKVSEKGIGTSGLLAHPGRILAQLSWLAGEAEWPHRPLREKQFQR